MKERNINSGLRDKILSLDDNDLRIQFFRPDEGMKIYHMSRGVIMDLAEEADALYKVGRSCIIDKTLFEVNLEKYKVQKKEEKNGK